MWIREIFFLKILWMERAATEENFLLLLAATAISLFSLSTLDQASRANPMR